MLAEEQESGRGKHGAKWISPKGGLWFSYVVNKKEKNPYIYIILSSVAVVEILKKYRVKAKIKWPNDILVNGKKLCGMLVENDSYAGKVVTGIGINVNNRVPIIGETHKRSARVRRTQVDKVPSKTEIPAVSLQRILRKKVNIEKLFIDIVCRIDKCLKAGKSKLVNKWVKNQVDITGKRIKIIKGKKTVSAEVLKVKKDGSVVVRDDKGKKKEIKGEVFFL